MEEPWDMMADKKIWAMLGNPDRPLSEDYIRLMFIELFSRVKALEHENTTLKLLMFQHGIVDEELYYDTLKEIKGYLKDWDDKKAKEIDFFSNSGISFIDWASFSTKGKFDHQSLKS